MKKQKYILLWFLFLMFSLQTIAQYNTTIKASLDIKSNGEFFDIKGFGDNLTETSSELRYVLSVIKNNPDTNNKSKNDQSGRIVLDAGQRKLLSTVSVNVNDKDRTIILLLIYDSDDVLLGQAREVLNDFSEEEALEAEIEMKNKISQDLSQGGSDGVFLKGIVVEETITKFGRDFFRLYINKYNQNRINGEKIITVEEVIALGTNTKIVVKSGNDVIFQNFINPRADYLNDLADFAIKRTKVYFERLKKNRNSIQRY